MRTKSLGDLRKPTSFMPPSLPTPPIVATPANLPIVATPPNPPMVAMPPTPPNLQMDTTLPGSDQNMAEKLSKIVPPYLMQRIFANINEISSLVMGGEWHTEKIKMLLKNEIQNLTENLNNPDLKVAIKELTEAADVPLTLFVEKFTEIIKKHIDNIINKLSNTVVNLVGEIPGVNVVTNSILAASNAVHVAKSVTELGKEVVDNLQKFKNDMTAVMEKFNPPMNQQLGQMTQPFGQPFNPQMMQPYPQQSQYGTPFGQPFNPQRQAGGSNAPGPRNMKDAKKHLHHLHRKKNRTLRRIHHSIHEFLTSSRNRRSIKAKAKH